MTEQGMGRSEWIRWLGEAISTECEKPFEEIDYAFVEECGRLLDELMECTAAIPMEELRERLAKVNPVAGSISDKKTVGNHRRLWTVAIAAAVVLCMSITVLAVPAWRAMILDVLELNIGESLVENGIVYTYNGENRHYDDMNTLMQNEQISILSPTALPEGLILQTIWHTEKPPLTILSFNDATIDFQISYEKNEIGSSIIKSAKKISYDKFDAYVINKSLNPPVFVAYFLYNNSKYTIMCPNETTLLSILESLK